ncbi:hypothetical protein LBWT_X0180 (plasmid) [Leptolyngbya boryana IAM M-101]|nr:hypothetical protein LBWT_X0180 [Leptolyngbya boryana IAM M-101]BAS66294.1 hypothetical protein LBDG_X0180 [Leptolyngbya boryana dg5]
MTCTATLQYILKSCVSGVLNGMKQSIQETLSAITGHKQSIFYQLIMTQ